MAEIGVGMLGYAFMGKAHSNAFKTIEYMTWPPPLVPKLVGIVGRNEPAVEEARERYGFEYATNDWREVVEDSRIGMFDNGGPLLEVNLFDFAGDLYGKTIDVAFIAWLRDEAKFGSVDELVRQMHDDARRAGETLARAGDAYPPI